MYKCNGLVDTEVIRLTTSFWATGGTLCFSRNRSIFPCFQIHMGLCVEVFVVVAYYPFALCTVSGDNSFCS